MLQEQVIPINFGGGTDTKTDPKAVVAGKFIRLENGVFTNPNRIAKRNGNAALNATIASVGSLVSPQLTHGYKSELIAADQTLLLSYSPSQSAWLPRGSYISTELTKLTVDQERAGSGYVDCAILGNYAVYGWSTASQSDSSFPIVKTQTYGSVVDLQTGTVLVGPTLLSTVSGTVVSPVRCILLGSTVLSIVYPKPDGTALYMRLVTFSGSGVVSFGTEHSITTNLNSEFFDIVNTTTGASILYQSTTGMTVANISTSATVSASVNIIDANAIYPFCISMNPFNNSLWLYWSEGASHAISYVVYSSTLSVILSKTTVVSLLSPYALSNMTAYSVSSTRQSFYYGQFVTTGGSNYIDKSSVVVTNSDGSVSVDTVFAYGVAPYSHPFSITAAGITNYYAVFIYRGSLAVLGSTPAGIPKQPTFFLVQLSNIPASISLGIPLVVARFGSGQAYSEVFSAATGLIAYTPNTSLFSSTKILFGCGLETQEFNTDTFEVNENGAVGGLVGSFSYYFDFNSPDAYRAVNAGQLALLNGGLVQAYDGQKCTEFGFHLFPEIGNISQSVVSGSNVGVGTYSYLAIFQWVDAQGNLHQSTPSSAASITVTGSNNNVTVIVTTNYLSQKSGVSVALYRTQSAGTVYYLVTDPVFINTVDPSVGATITFNDSLADSSLPGNPNPYTSPSSSVLENSTPPPSMIMVAHNNRLSLVNSESRNEIWYTKSFQPATGLSPSAFMTQQIDPKYGDITALAEMDANLVIAKQLGFVIQSGDGVNDTGSGSTLSFPQFIPSDVGCSVLKSAITIPKGLMFKSPNGIYILDRSLNISYIGAEVESYNSQVITGATLVPGKSQLRFLCSSGLALVYDYIFNQWSTFTGHTGNSSTTWNNLYVYSTGSAVYQEAPGVYTDNGASFSLLAQTSWLALASIQGFQRVKRLIMLGDYINGNSASHNLSISAAYNFSTTFQSAISYVFGAISSSGVFQYRERLPIQKCDSISLLIQETTTGNSAEYVDLTNISFEAGIKKGVNKLGGLQSVG